MTPQEIQTDILYIRRKLFILMKEADKLNESCKDGIAPLLLQSYDNLEKVNAIIDARGPTSSHNQGEIWK